MTNVENVLLSTTKQGYRVISVGNTEHSVERFIGANARIAN